MSKVILKQLESFKSTLERWTKEGPSDGVDPAIHQAQCEGLQSLIETLTSSLNEPLVLFSKEYDGESIADLDRDITEALSPTFNDNIDGIPVDEQGIQSGTFKLTLTWVPE